MVCEIVGIVGNARQSVLTEDAQPIYYFPFRQLPWGPPPILVRTSVPPLTLEASLRQVITALDKDVPLDNLRAFDDMLTSDRAGPQFQVLVMGSFALIALLLTAAGLYGVLAYSVLRRTREIGVRMALGADRRIVVQMVLHRAMVLVLFGVPLGIGGALAGNALLLRMLTGAGPGSAPLLMVSSAVVILTAGAAAYPPARRAASIDPTVALRTE
jgi:ABC-type antimicrobial peptide transport system permease subunit